MIVMEQPVFAGGHFAEWNAGDYVDQYLSLSSHYRDASQLR